MEVVVCINVIPDPDIPRQEFRIDEERRSIRTETVRWVVGPYDENALELALQLRDNDSATEVTVITVGNERSELALRKGLALQAHRAVMVRDAGVTDIDAFGTAHVLAAAIRKIDGVDLILCGRQGGSWDGGQVGPLLAQELKLPCVTLAAKIEVAGTQVRVRREVEAGAQIVEAPLPCLVTVTNDEANRLRIPKTRDVMMAARQPLTIWPVAELAISPKRLAPRLQVRNLFVPKIATSCKMIDGRDGPEKVANLTRDLITQKIL